MYDQSIYGGGGGQVWWMGRGVAVKDFEVGYWGGGVIKGYFQKHLKTLGTPRKILMVHFSQRINALVSRN